MAKLNNMTASIVYKGNLRTEMTHIESGTIVETDAPKDNFGKGEKFSPTDLLASSLGSCMMSIMAIKGRNLGLNFDDTRIEITKIMSSDAPRRVVEIKLAFHFTQHFKPTEEQKTLLEEYARTCPVEKSLHPDIKIDCRFNW